MHLIGMDRYILGGSAVVGTSIPVAVGFALALKREGKGRVVAAFFGDGATEEGVFHECMNFAALHKLPVLFVCENNLYAIHEPLHKRWATTQLCERVRTYGIPAHQITSGDVIEIRRLAAEAIAGMRSGEQGPAFLECHTYRWREHVGPAEDYDAGYRGRDELVPWQERDQVQRMVARIDASERACIDAEIELAIVKAFEFAEESEFPGSEDLYRHVFAQ